MTEPKRHFSVLPGGKPPQQADSGEMAHSAYPLALHAWDPTEIEQTSFGVHAAVLLDGLCPDIVIEATRSGLTLFARSEPALVAPVDRLLAHFGHDRVRLTGPHVRYWPGTPLRWPVMIVRVRVPRSFAAQVRFDLTARRGRSLVVELGPLVSLIAAELPQTKLIGYPGWLHEVTGGLWELSIRLSHYAPPDSNPDPAPCPA